MYVANMSYNNDLEKSHVDNNYASSFKQVPVIWCHYSVPRGWVKSIVPTKANCCFFFHRHNRV